MTTNCGEFCKDYFSNFIGNIVRKKRFKGDDLQKTSLARCLNTMDLTALGIGSTLGAGVYVVTGQVARQTAGPAVIISFLIAAFASVLAGLCYAEFGSRVPRTGSAYVYSYVAVGEIMAFIIGWNLILEYIIGTSSVAKAWSANLDEVTGGHIHSLLNRTMSIHVTGLSEYPDWFASGITIILTILLSVGVKESTKFNNIFTILNITVVLYVVICGCWHLNINNWRIPPVHNSTNSLNYNTHIHYGYFFPFGVSGVISGAATCFYAFVGFDAISTTGEEAINPQKAIPISIILCLAVCFIAYASVSAIITLMCPFYLINADAPLPFIFQQVGWIVAKYIVGFGAIFGLSTSLMGSMFPLPRIIYAMSNDGLLFRFLAKINSRTKTPLLATILSGIFAAIMAALFELKTLVDMMSIGTLLAYTLVALSVLMLRGSMHSVDSDDYDCYQSVDETKITFKEYLRNMFNHKTSKPTKMTDFITRANCYIIFCLILILDGLLIELSSNPILISFAVILFAVIIIFGASLKCQPENLKKISFKVPLVPWVPILSIIINLYLMMKLPTDTWYRFGIWMVIGFIIYFCYGIRHSEKIHSINSDTQHILKST